MKQKLQTAARIFLGLILVLFGSNKFLGFMPMPPLPAEAAQFMGALASSGYIFPVVGFVEVLVGVLLISGLFVPLALQLLAPISVNIMLFHLFLDLPGIGGAAVVSVLNLYLIFQYKSHYAKILVAK